MPHRRQRANSRLRESRRRQIAVEAARIMHNEGMRDFLHAKHKAADRLGIFNASELPTNIEIDQALREHQSLFRTQDDYELLNRLRTDALRSMEFFKDFHPRLVGPVLEGTADRFSAVCLHVFTDNLEQLCHFLNDHRVPFDQTQRKLQLRRGVHAELPVLRFTAGQTPMDMTVFPLEGRRQAPLSAINGRPVTRATPSAVEALLTETPERLAG